MLRLSVLFTTFSILVNAQNLVPNHSFECGSDRCDPTVFAADLYMNACDWSCPQRGTTDIFSTKIPNKACFCSMPYNGTDTSDETAHVGSQEPRSGSRFAGIFTYSVEPEKDTSYREYLQAQLTEPLIPGRTYCSRMYTSRAEHLKYASNNLGIYFSDSKFSIGGYVGPLHVIPHVIERDVIDETVLWREVCGVFEVSDTAQYVIIGNFSYNYQTQAVVREGAVRLEKYSNYAYYFIDDVSVTEIDIPELTYSGSQVICEGDNTSIEVLGEWDEVTWSELSDTAVITGVSRYLRVNPDSTTGYLVRATICGHQVKDTVTITVVPRPTVDLGRDTTICAGSSIPLDAGPDHISISWQDASGERFFVATEPGRYSVSVTNEFACENRDEININVMEEPYVSLGNDTTVCRLFLLDTGEGTIDHLWSDGSQSSTMLPLQYGPHWVRLKNQCGEATDTINLYSFSDIFIPNIVTPNNDGLNETLLVKVHTANMSPALNIYDRWGGIIFSDESYDGNWPPKSGGNAEGTYYYVCRFPQCPPIKGWVQVKY